MSEEEMQRIRHEWQALPDQKYEWEDVQMWLDFAKERVPKLLAEIDRLRKIEALAREIFAENDSCLQQALGNDLYRRGREIMTRLPASSAYPSSAARNS